MLRLDLSNEPRWLDLGHGVRLLVEPLTTAVMMQARRDLARGGALDGIGPDDEVEADDGRNEELGTAMAMAVALRVIRDWEGVGDVDGQPLPVSEDGIRALMSLWPIFEAFQLRYLEGYVLLEQEKNGSALSPSGTSAGARTTAAGARGRAPSAHTKPKPRARKKAPRSGS